MNKKLISIFLLFCFIFTFPFVIAEDYVIPEGIITSEMIEQAQQSIADFGDLKNEIQEVKNFVEERTNLLASFMVGELKAGISFLIIVIIISNLCTAMLVIGIITILKGKGRW